MSLSSKKNFSKNHEESEMILKDRSENSIYFEKIPSILIRSIALIKKVAAQVNYSFKILDRKKSLAIVEAAEEIISGKHEEKFSLTVWQMGSGTQTNMNVNQVIADRANQILLSKDRSCFIQLVHPIDHVNRGQSSNDVFLSAMHIASFLSIKKNLLNSIEILKNTFKKKSKDFYKVIKVGRTHLQDAVPITLGQEISAWSTSLSSHLKDLKKIIPDLLELPIGGTAVGTGINSFPNFDKMMVNQISNSLNTDFFVSINKFESISTCRAIISVHSILKCLAISMMKITNDIKILASGPRCGIGEIFIPNHEIGSSIMPGKMNPTQCEVMNMICAQVLGNDVSINFGGSLGILELNTFRPMIINNFLQSIRILSEGISNFDKYCASGIQPNYKRINEFLKKSLMLATILNEKIGYDRSAKIVKKAYEEDITLFEANQKLGYLTEEEFLDWIDPKKMI
ncbi:class II fumarate hydratase [Candidatus Riesia pediculicola]|uniref:fumarate hydratase n=1 Tax=Riesia pediculicola (strain USDA) TaxID=515618 RepID=D4G7K9_RIEPU|nr:class II fumarate hydratase [Candidatus Riesia pediculicola]ADD79871.1 fumarate hydratase, class II [Candidatus Riesia pediculicola USDA]